MNPGRLLLDKVCFFLAVSAMLCSGQMLPITAPPLHLGHPFLFMWNAPTELCKTRFGMPLDLSHFDFVSSTLKSATNQSISIFYIDRFGIFPYVDEDTGKIYDEGLPQFIDFVEHHELAEDDIEYYIAIEQPGLSVLDFEAWRPQWSRNWGSKDIYRQISISTIKQKNPTLSDDEAEERAKIVFERAARKYFVRSIGIGKRLRPKRLWGYYLYPDCYNYDYNQDMAEFTGECPDIEKQRNNELLWLWKESTALYPSIYLELVLRNSYQARMFVRHRIQEAMRVSTLPNSSYAIPVYAYIRPIYKDSVDVYMSEDSCFEAWHNLKQVMNPYILNVSTATQLCSKALCQGRGRCKRKHWDEDAFLHLDPHGYVIESYHRGGPLVVRGGGLSQYDIYQFDRNFDCLCYSEEPCHSPLILNAIPETVSTGGNSSGCCPIHRPDLLILCLALLGLKYAIM